MAKIKPKNLATILYFFAGALFLLTYLRDSETLTLILGICFFIFGASSLSGKKKDN